MENRYSRYATYWRPEPGALADFGARWLGWDPASGTHVAHPASTLDVAAITQTPRKYGLHGTVKPPMRLKDGLSEAELVGAFDALCSSLAPVELPGLALSRLGHFLALTPTGDMSDLSDLAAHVVRDLDSFRAPAAEAELARRRAAGLSDAQEANLLSWGYPYVMEEFKFHITLSGRLTTELAEKVMDEISPQLDPITPRPFVINSLMLLGEDADGNFHDIHRAPLLG